MHSLGATWTRVITGRARPWRCEASFISSCAALAPPLLFCFVDALSLRCFSPRFPYIIGSARSCAASVRPCSPLHGYYGSRSGLGTCHHTRRG